MIKNIYITSLLSTFFLLIPLGFSYGQTTTSSSVCTGEIRTSEADAQRCVNLAQSQGTALGYTTSCRVERVELVAGVDPLSGLDHYFQGVCTVNGSTGHAAYLLAGFQAATTSNALIQTQSPGWNILQTELQYEAAYRQCGDKPPFYANGAYSCSVPVNSQNNIPVFGVPSTKVSTGTTSSTTTVKSDATSPSAIIQKTQDAVFKTAFQDVKSTIERYSDYTKSILGFNLSTSVTSTNTTTTPPAGTVCHEFSGTYQLGDSGVGVNFIIEALKNAGLLAKTDKPLFFDESVKKAVVLFQEKNKASILTPLGLTSGTGIVSTRTNAEFTKQCLAKEVLAALPPVVDTKTSPIISTSTSIVLDPSITGSNAPISNATNGGPTCTPIRPFPLSASYIKIGSQTSSWVSWGEIEVLDMNGNKIKPVTSYASATYGTDVSQNTYDGNVKTSWNSGRTFAQSGCSAALGVYSWCTNTADLVLDLGGIKQISKIRMYVKSNPSPSDAWHFVMITTSDRVDNFVQVNQIKGKATDGTWLETCN
jgi:hypothetical protein